MLGLKAIATRSWGALRAHANASVTPTSDEPGPAAEPEWSASLAVDRTFFRSSLLMLGELGVLQEPGVAATEAAVAAGVRYQLTPTLVLDAGLRRRLGSAGPDLGVTVGVAHAFGLAALHPHAPPPAPRPGRPRLGRTISSTCPARSTGGSSPATPRRRGCSTPSTTATPSCTSCCSPGATAPMPRSRGSTASSPAISWSGRPRLGVAEEVVMPQLRPRDLAGEADVRLGPRPPPPDLRCLCRRRG